MDFNEPRLQQALNRICDFIEKTTGRPASPKELADAMTKYFVLNEIKSHIEMIRKTPED